MRGPVVSYVVALAAVAAAVVVRLSFEPLLGDRLPFITLLAAVIFVAWHGGRGPALLALVVGLVAVAYFILQPRYTFAINQIEYQVGLVLYIVVGLAAIAMFDSLDKARRRVEEKQTQLEQEVAARRTAEKALAEQKERLRVTLASIGDAVLTTDSEGRIAYLNAVAESLTGWTQNDAAGRPLDDIFRIVNEETHQPVENPVTRAMRECLVAGLPNHTILIRKDGTGQPIDDSASPIRDEYGHVTGCVLIFRDISERRRAENKLVDEDARIRSVLNHVLDGIIAIDEHGIVEAFNPAAERLFGYKAEEIVGQNIKMLMPDPFHSEHDGYLANYRRTGQAKIIGIGREVKGRRKDGSTFPMELAVGEYWLSKRRYFTGIVRDITERKRIETEMHDLLIELKDGDRRKDEFLATLAHELRNPLAPLRNTLEILKRTDCHGELLQQARATMERQLEQMVRLVDDLLDVSRITRNKLDLRKERVELAAAIHQAVEMCRPLIQDARHEITVTLTPEPIFLDADPVRLAQIFSNLLNNSCKYTDPGGHIEVAAERQGSDVVVKVSDNGTGIPPDMLPKIFEMFTQVERSLERSHGGLGIGLTLVKRLVEMHSGSVEAFSEGPGRGSEFVVRLPVLIESPKYKATASTAALPAMTARRILVVDDNRDSAATLAMLLELAGNTTQTAYDGLEAVEAAEKFRPDVVLLDIGLPKLNGHDACRRIREQPWGKDMMLVALTGWGQDEDRHKSKAAGFDHHLVKPVDLAALTNLLVES